MRLPSTHMLFLVAIAGTALVTDSLLIGLALAVLYLAGLGAASKGWTISQTVEMILAFLILPPSYMYTQFKGDSALITFQYWMTLLLVVRAWKKLEQRDYFFSLCMAAGIYTQIGKVYSDFPFFFLTLLNVILAPLALNELFIRFHPGVEASSQIAIPTPRHRMVRAMSLGAVSLLLAATMTLVFLVLPRGGQPNGLLSQDLAARLTGFSENVALGSFSRIKDNPQLAMRVTTDKPGMWRGAVLDMYRNGVWQSSQAQYKWRKPVETGATKPGAPLFKHRIQILNLNLVNFRFFTKGDTVSINRIDAPSVIWINDLNGTLGVPLVDVRNTRQVEYEVEVQESEYFGLPELTDRRWKSAFSQDRILETELYVQVPDDVSTEVRALALRLTQGVPTEAEKVRAVEQYLRDTCEYALTDLDSGDRPPLDYFLFDSKRGHCEYFATAMAMLLRCAGVPTRVVQGFGPGIWVDGSYAIRMGDAHLWVDVFYPGLGWKSHDPTPVMDSALSGDAGYGTWFERLQIQWLTYVMAYNGTSQLDLLGRFSDWAQWPLSFLRSIRSALGPIMSHLGWAVMGVLLAGGMGVAFRWVSRKRKGRVPLDAHRDEGMPDYYKKYLHVLSRHGYVRGANATAMELLNRLTADSVPVLPEARLLTDFYLRARYRADALSPEDLARVRTALTSLRKWTYKT